MKSQQWRPSHALKKRKNNYFLLIELSGLVSIMIFFLALFMAPTLLNPHHTRYVDLPLVNHPKTMPGALKDDALQVLLARDGAIYFGGSKVSLSELVPLLQKGVREGSERKVYLRADARAKYGDVKVVADQIRLAGIENVALITEETRPKTTP